MSSNARTLTLATLADLAQLARTSARIADRATLRLAEQCAVVTPHGIVTTPDARLAARIRRAIGGHVK